MKAIATAMGLKIKVVDATFDSIIPGLASGKYDVGASSFADQGAREDRRLRRLPHRPASRSTPRLREGRRSTRSPTYAATRSPSSAAQPSRPTRTPRARSARPPASPQSPVLPFADQNGANLALVSGRSYGFSFAPGRVPGQEVKRPVQARRPVVRQRPLRARLPQEQPPRCGRPGGNSRPSDEERDLQLDPVQVGSAVRRDLQPQDQRGDELKVADATVRV